MAENQKDPMSKQSGGKGGTQPGGAAGGGTSGSSRTGMSDAGHENGVGQIYAEQGFGVNEAMSEPVRDDAVVDEPVGGAGSGGSGGGADMDAGGQPGGVPGQAVADPGVNIDKGHTESGRKG